MDESTFKLLLFSLLSASVPIIIVCLIWLSKKINNFIELKANQVKESIENETIKDYIDILKDNAITVVNSLNQTTVNDLKAASEDGKLTDVEIKEISSNAVSTMYDMVSRDVLDILTKVYNDIDTLFGNMIEEAVLKVKKEN